MADGIRINDAALEIAPEALAALVNKEGASVIVNRLDVSVSPEALATLLRGLAPEGTPPPSVAVQEGGLQFSGEREGKRLGVDLRMGGLRLRFTPEGLHLTSEER